MTIAPSPSINVILPVGTSAGPWPTGFTYSDPDDVRVIVETNGIAGAPLVAIADYALTATDPRQNGGLVMLSPTIVPPEGWTDGHRLILQRRTARRQGLALPDAEGHKPRATERSLDHVIRIVQEDRDDLDRAIVTPFGEEGLQLPSRAARAGRSRVLGSNPDGDLALLDGGAFKGDPGGNVLAVGLFVDLPNMAIPAGADIIQTSGYDVVGLGAARYVAVEAGPTTRWRRQSQNGRWFELAEERPSARQMGARGDGLTADTAAVQALLDFLPPDGAAHLDEGEYLVAGLSKAFEPRFSGPGRLVSAAAQGGRYAISSYADAGRVMIGAEYRYRLLLRMKVGGALTGFIYGDSTVATAANGGGYAGVEGEPQNLLARMLRRKGVRNPISLTNRAVGGSSWADIDAAADAPGGAVDLMIFKSSINQVSGGDVFAEAAAIRAKVAAVRAVAHGTVDQITIILMMPSATFDPQHGRTSIWYEKLRSVYEAVAREFKCVLFDTYSLLRDVDWAANAALGLMMDNPFGNGQGVHPMEIMQVMIWGALADALIGYSDLVLYDNNDTVNLGLTNGWVNYGEGWKPSYASMDREGWVQLGGLIKSGVVGAAEVIGNVPAGYEPQDAELFAVLTAGGTCSIRILTNGQIVQHDGGASAIYTSLGGVRYKVR